jgi:hypothetical protein
MIGFDRVAQPREGFPTNCGQKGRGLEVWCQGMEPLRDTIRGLVGTKAIRQTGKRYAPALTHEHFIDPVSAVAAVGVEADEPSRVSSLYCCDLALCDAMV